jgi:hypothetical protein
MGWGSMTLPSGIPTTTLAPEVKRYVVFGCIQRSGAGTHCGRNADAGEFIFYDVEHAINCYDSRTNKIARGGVEACHTCIDAYKTRQAKESAERSK